MTDANEDSLDGSSWVGYTIVNPESGENFSLPFAEPDGTLITVSMELAADGTGWLEFAGEYENITWDCDGAYALWLTREGGQQVNMTLYTMGARQWLLADLEGYVFWLYCA